MTKPFLTAQKLAVVEGLIEDFRWARSKPAAPENHTYQVLKVIAVDLRGQLDGAPHVAEVELSRRVNAVIANGSSTGRMVALAHEVMARWSVIKQALERFAAAAQEERR